MTPQTRIQRLFLDWSQDRELDVDPMYALMLKRYGGAGGLSWEELLCSKRVLIISEAGAGKTHECREERKKLWEAGEPAFFVELAELSRNDLIDMLDHEEQQRFEAWRISQSDIATFFLDSIDELKLTQGSFEMALKRFFRALAGQLARVRVVVTTRPIEFDRRLIHRHLAVPQRAEGPTNASGSDFADAVMSRHRNEVPADAGPPEWRTVMLMPFSTEQVRQMAVLQGISDPDAFLQDIEKGSAEDFTRRPQDLIELCASWNDSNPHRIRSHREQVEHNIKVKLRPNTGREKDAPLAEAKAFEGASRLALAALLTRRLTIRHSANAERASESAAALDTGLVLPDWSEPERKALLERALFGFASYQRVRFHHRSVIEYLAAKRLDDLLNRGVSIKTIKRLLFAQTLQGEKVVKPSMRPVAAWLAGFRADFFREVRDREPELLLNDADPQSLLTGQRLDVLRAYAQRYGTGSWRGLHVPRVQVQRFASADLGPEIQRLWSVGIENREVRELLMEIIALAPIMSCSGIAYSVVLDREADSGERIHALSALISMNDDRLAAVVESLVSEADLWPERLAGNAITQLFPTHIDVVRLCRVMDRLKPAARYGWDWVRHVLTPKIAEAPLALTDMQQLRAELSRLVMAGAVWDQDHDRINTSKPHLRKPLAAVCLRLIKTGDLGPEVIQSSVLALRLDANDGYRESDDPLVRLRSVFEQQPAPARKAVFWADDAFCQQYHPQQDPWRRFWNVHHRGAVRLSHQQDAEWVREILADAQSPLDMRRVMLEASLQAVWDGQGERVDQLRKLRPLVEDAPELVSVIDAALQPREPDPNVVRWEAEAQERKKERERQDAEARESWIRFWRKVVESPETAFSPDEAGDTAWNLWKAMRRSGDHSREFGWNRRFVEQYFGKDAADRSRLALIAAWRKVRPTLRSERSEDEKNSYFEHWLFGLAGVAAEAEDPQWTHKLSATEAETAARYVPMELNGFPSWFESLVETHPEVVDAVLGAELTAELNEQALHAHAGILQDLGHATETTTALFLPRLRAWLDAHGQEQEASDGENKAHADERLRQVVEILLRHGDVDGYIAQIAAEKASQGLDAPRAMIWMPILMRLNPSVGVDVLERALHASEPAPLGLGVEWMGALFNERHGGTSIDLSQPGFEPALLLRLVRLAYRHVRSSDDVKHEGAYRPGPRDHAESGRSALLSALLKAKGQKAWAAKMEMANDPLLADLRDRVLQLMREKAAEEVDTATLAESDVATLDAKRDISPITRDDMFALLLDRLDDLEELLLSDFSPREAWAGLQEEKLMRREIARVFSDRANHAYVVAQEEVTADEKETDIRLHATASNQQAVIELKIGEKGWSGRDLRDTIKNQLVRKYLAADERGSGCLLVTVSKDRRWDDPGTGASLDMTGLAAMLQREVEKVSAEMGGLLRITARVLDLRPGLSQK
ncbi:ATP-binding protein [Hylemonella gracilis]|uniref:ATP-binding protein n=1 Tax=Hylemonella gracilis TaxID=80880 RepID=A0A4P6UJJ5_9BURK|nr:ATP-binding protein [Hylemonella gracilis]QBK04257.1 ATP-binding protein [Hylemonella gracilis]